MDSAPPPPPPPSYAAATHEMNAFYAPPMHPQHNSGPLVGHPHSPTRRGPPERDDGLSESIDPAKYKTRMCQAFMLGSACAFGSRCAFAHGPQELRQSIPQAPPPPPPPPSYHQALHQSAVPQDYSGSAGPSSPLHSRPQTPRGTVQTFPQTETVLSPGRNPVVHPRNSLPSSPVTAGDQAYPTFPANRFRNEPYSPTGFVYQPDAPAVS
mmetsp:Transcript_10664/g.12225  ORF Transcript_10664/g.12225 Transcript_10664/m.12225 type:complete len:210 (+) Transcript_10664:146-775(+)|eukprot:CAMPEP_0176460524 /NCGR_PEP_ID=MMETSP0127-20121128/34034_1 /TAXON_ID=938130 /ORGANISM="Platyophrya macrostoma, Strain WH" /LENGTH=209 /DNA_ID=CAMNT_0017851889 /DNA_START=130 /DNA_END=759 /DNA_ORIENTATION=+